MPTHVEFRNGKAILSIADYEELTGKTAQALVEDNAAEAEREAATYDEPVAVQEKRERQDEAVPDTTQNGVVPNATQRNAEPVDAPVATDEVPAEGVKTGRKTK